MNYAATSGYATTIAGGTGSNLILSDGRMGRSPQPRDSLRIDNGAVRIPADLQGGAGVQEICRPAARGGAGGFRGWKHGALSGGLF
ncbi:MAG: hypothetical protein WCT47_22640 [Betaproteobacteria bacterium]